jgi:hypothetical protein
MRASCDTGHLTRNAHVMNAFREICHTCSGPGRDRVQSASKRANPTERRGRKVTGLQSRALHDREIAEGESSAFRQSSLP